jgi:hypothetical protein
LHLLLPGGSFDFVATGFLYSRSAVAFAVGVALLLPGGAFVATGFLYSRSAVAFAVGIVFAAAG